MEGPDEVPDFAEPMPCYDSNPSLGPSSDDGLCEHCSKFLTTECAYIDHFLEEDEG